MEEEAQRPKLGASLRKNFKNSAKNKIWNYSSLWVSLRHTKPDETGKLSSMCHSMCHSMRLTKPHEEGYCDREDFLKHIFWRFNSPLHVLLWGSLSGTLSGTLRIVFQSHLVLCASMRIIVRNNFSFCFLHYFSNFFSKFWYFINVINPIYLANSKNSPTPWIRSKLPEI